MTRSEPVRRLEVLARLTAAQVNGGSAAICTVCRDTTGTTGAGIMLMSETTSQGSICSTDPVSALLERIQYDLGQGPCIDAFTSDRPVSEPLLAASEHVRWPAFTPLAVDAGARAVFGFPLRVGAARVGALNLYCDQAGALSDDQHASALIAADIAARAVLLLQAGAQPGSLATELDAGGEFHWVVHQAAGMVAAQLGVTVLEALIRLRAHAFGTGQDLTDVARDVVDRRLRLDGGADGAELS